MLARPTTAIAALLVSFGSACSTSPASSTGTAERAQSTREDTVLRDSIEAIRAAHRLPALAVAAARGGELVGVATTGVRRAGDPTPATDDDRWHLGSCTKAMTATLVAMLVDEGKLAWTDTLATLFPGEAIHPNRREVTLEMALQHRGGFPAQPHGWSEMWSDAAASKAPAPTRHRAVQADLAAAPDDAPIGQYLYSNAGYMAVGVALEQVTGRDWEALVTERIFTPLGMTSCGFGPAASPPASVDQPWSHRGAPPYTPVPPDVRADNPISLGPAGTVHCSLRDWARFLALHAQEGGSLVSAASMKRLHTPPTDGFYAGGWIVTARPWAGGTAYTHTGSNTMNVAVTWIAPAKELVLVATTNAGDRGAQAAVDEAMGPLIARFATDAPSAR